MFSDKNSSFRTVQIAANKVFKTDGRPNLLPLVRKAVDLNHAIITEGHLLATIHTLRLLQANIPLPRLTSGEKETAWRSMLEQCYAAVSQATGPGCQNFSASKHPELAASLALYQQCLPPGHAKPTRPTWLKTVGQCHICDILLALCTLQGVVKT